MTPVWGRERLRWERFSVTPSVALSVALLDSFLSFKSGDKLSNQPVGPLKTKLPVTNAVAATSILKYSEHDLQRIFKAVLEAQALAPIPTPAFVVFKAPQEKLKANFPDIYCEKSHINCYNFCQ